MKKLLCSASLLLALFAAPAAFAFPACGDEWGDLDSIELDASDLAVHAKTPGQVPYYGKAACLTGGEENLIPLRWKVEKAFRAAVEKNYAAYAKYGQPEEGDYICRFEDTRGLDSAMSFEMPEADNELHKSYRKTTCGKGKHFGFAEISLVESAVKLRCGSREKLSEWERQCGGRDPSSVKAIKGKGKKGAPKKK